MALENKLFAKYGHQCELTTIRDDLPMFRSGGNIYTQIKNSFRRSTMACDDNINSLKFLKSQKRVEAERVSQAVQHRFMIHPFSDYRRGWEAFMIPIFVIVFIIIPLDIASFNFPLKNSICVFTTWKIIRTLCDLLLCADIVMNFFTGYWDQRNSRVVMNPRRVAVRYVCTFFIFDLLSSLPTHLDLFMKGGGIRKAMFYFQNLSIFKVLRIITFLRYCRQTCEAHSWNYLKYRLILAIFCYVLYFHILTCVHIVAVGASVNETNTRKVSATHSTTPIYLWTESGKENDFFGSYARLLRSSVYLSTFCFSSRTLSNYVPKSLYVVEWIVSKIVTFFLISQFMEVAMSSRSSSRKYFEMLRELEEYMMHKQLPVSLQRRLLEYYEFKFQKSYFRESEILNILSGQLKQDLVMHSCRKLVEHVTFFQNLPMQLIVRIVSSLAIEIFMVNDVIVKVNTPGTCMYFIASGCVSVYTRNGYEVKHLEDGEYFGEYSLLKHGVRECSVVAVETCELYRLEQGDFVRVIMSYPDLIEKIKKHAVDRIEMTEFIEARFNRRKRAQAHGVPRHRDEA